LVALRTRLGLTQARLAQATGVHQSEISRIERGVGNPTQGTLDRLGKALGASMTIASPTAEPRHTPGSRQPSRSIASPYATGGGGVHFERLTGAFYLGALLVNRAPPPLWESSSIVELRFQQAADGADLDDLVIVAEASDNVARTVEVAVRHRPTFGASDAKFVALVAGCLRSLRDHAAEYEVDARRLCIVVSEGTPNSPALRELTKVARSQLSSEAFAAAVKNKTNRHLVNLHGRLSDVANAARQTAGLALGADDGELWLLLRAMYVVALDLEGGDARDISRLVDDLMVSVADGDRAVAVGLLERLVNVAAEWASRGARVDEDVLRRDLAARFPLQRSIRHPAAWSQLERLTERAQASTSDQLQGRLHLERESVQQMLTTALRGETPVLVHGEPGTGKSAACRMAARAAAGELVVLAVHDLPPTLMEFEHLLGCGLPKVLAGAARGGRPVLVLDGAEAVLESRDSLVRDLLSAIPAGPTGWQVCIVSRTEGSRRLVDLTRAVWPDSSPTITVVPGLDDGELSRVAEEFPRLRYLLEQPRARWLMRRPFYVDLALRDGMDDLLSRTHICEADVMAAVWRETVRLGERMGTPKGSPDGRHDVMATLARARLAGQPVSEIRHGEPAAVTGLRVDGLVSGASLGRRPGPADFAHDVVRDFAVAELLLASNELVAPLLDAGTPRWSLRASRLACQDRLVTVGDADLAASFMAIQRAFEAVADQSGDRWLDVPWEALVTTADPQRALGLLRDDLMADSAAGVARILSILESRFSTDGLVAETAVWESVVGAILEKHDDLPEAVLIALDEAITDLLHSVAAADLSVDREQPERARIARLAPAFVERVRGYLLERAPGRRNHVVLRGLALLGGALDDDVASALRRAGADEPAELETVVNDIVVARRIVDQRPDLLLDLASLYYIDDRPSPGWERSPLDDGVRDHRTGHMGFPFANWYYGPFFLLLRTKPLDAIAFINRLLDHAARARIGALGELSSADADAQEGGVALKLLDSDETTYGGDGHVYRWYRGTAVGPYPCVSALLALEVFVDQLIENGLPLRQIRRLLLPGAHNLAMLGLWVGVLVRHIEKVGDELDVFLATPAIWALEAERVTAELSGFKAHVPESLSGEDRRGWTLSDVAAYLVVQSPPERAGDLRRIRDTLLASPRDPIILANWASKLDPGSYSLEPAEQGLLVIHKPPEEVTVELERRAQPRNLFMDMWRLQHSYGRPSSQESPPTNEQLMADVAVAREAAELLRTEPNDTVCDAIAATAAAALRSHFEGGVALADDVMAWVAEILVEFGLLAPYRANEFDVPNAQWEVGWDRSAARAVPLLMRHGVDVPGLDTAMVHLGRTPLYETQRALGGALLCIWEAPCSGADMQLCLHRRAFAALEEMVAALGRGPWSNELQRRPHRRLADPLAESLRSCPVDQVAPNMGYAALALDICATSSCCVTVEAGTLLDALIDLHARVWVYQVSGRDRSDTLHAEPVHQVAADRVLRGDDKLMERLLATYEGHASVLAAWLVALATAAVTREQQERLRDLWPPLMERLIPTLKGADDHSQYRAREDLTEALIAVPYPGISVATWVRATDIDTQVGSLIDNGKSGTELANQLVRFLGVQTAGDQMTYGLNWLLSLVSGHEGYFASFTRIPEWLRHLRDDHADSFDLNARRKWHRLVDALAGAGDKGAIRLQQQEE
jgi:transcriptional regulator with XRE-family HTH domain